MTALLLDTHVLLWAASADPRLTNAAREVMRRAQIRFVSAASGYEIAQKVRLGKLPGGDRVLDGWSVLLRALQATELPLGVDHMIRAGALEWTHRDPFDRMLVAQAQVGNATILTDDHKIRSLEQVSTVWPMERD